ncbi:MAG: OmpP1/FadL family transporter [Gammaproteobacteria bacterium]
MRHTQPWMFLLAAGTALSLSAGAYAGSFQLNEASAKSLARSNAGDASANKDASANYYNPALLTYLKKASFLIGATDYKIRGEFSKFSATDASGQPLSGGNGGDFGQHNRIGAGVTPILSFGMPLTDRTAFGVALEVPFGLTTTYNGDSVLRYQAQYTSITVNNINPNFAYNVGDGFSIGIGADFAKVSAKLTNQIDYGAVCYSELGPLTCNGLGLSPQSHDGYFQIEGDDWAYGWNAGIAWQNHAGTTIGLAYRSRLFFNLSGTAEYQNVPAVFAPSGAFQNTGVHARLALPDTIDLSASQDIGPAWRVSGSVRYVRWSTFQDLNVTYDNPNQPESTQIYDYRNAWSVALGADYRLNASWTLHGGIAYDQSPVRNLYREPRLPDSSRRWASVGATYNLTPSNSITLGWAHLFIGDHIPMNNTGPSGSTVIGQWSENADLFSLQYEIKF